MTVEREMEFLSLQERKFSEVYTFMDLVLCQFLMTDKVVNRKYGLNLIVN